MNILKQLGIAFSIVVLFFAGVVWADTNGVWVDAQDIRAGEFGFDEALAGGQFSFGNDVTFYGNIIAQANVEANSDVNVEGTLRADVIQPNTPGQNIVIKLG